MGRELKRSSKIAKQIIALTTALTVKLKINKDTAHSATLSAPSICNTVAITLEIA